MPQFQPLEASMRPTEKRTPSPRISAREVCEALEDSKQKLAWCTRVVGALSGYKSDEATGKDVIEFQQRPYRIIADLEAGSFGAPSPKRQIDRMPKLASDMPAWAMKIFDAGGIWHSIAFGGLGGDDSLKARSTRLLAPVYRSRREAGGHLGAISKPARARGPSCGVFVGDATMALSDMAIRIARPGEKPCEMIDVGARPPVLESSPRRPPGKVPVAHDGEVASLRPMHVGEAQLAQAAILSGIAWPAFAR